MMCCGPQMTPSRAACGEFETPVLRGPSNTALNSPLAVMQNFATFEWLLCKQELLGGQFK